MNQITEIPEEYKSLIGDSIVRRNLLMDVNYRPYCGSINNECDSPRTQYRPIDGQFICPHCNWRSSFPKEFIEAYNRIHNIKPAK